MAITSKPLKYHNNIHGTRLAMASARDCVRPLLFARVTSEVEKKSWVFSAR
jgi:hypothetical protein